MKYFGFINTAEESLKEKRLIFDGPEKGKASPAESQNGSRQGPQEGVDTSIDQAGVVTALDGKIKEWEDLSGNTNYTQQFREAVLACAEDARRMKGDLEKSDPTMNLLDYSARLDAMIGLVEAGLDLEEKKLQKLDKIEAVKTAFETDKDKQKTEFIDELLTGLEEPYLSLLRTQLTESFEQIEQPFFDKVEISRQETENATQESMMPTDEEITALPGDMKTYLDVKTSDKTAKQFPSVAVTVIDQQEYVSNAGYFINKTEREKLLRDKEAGPECRKALDKWDAKFQTEYLSQNKLPSRAELTNLVNQANHEIVVGYLVDKVNETTPDAKITPEEFAVFIQNYEKGETGTLDPATREKITGLFAKIQPYFAEVGIRVHVEGSADAINFSLKGGVEKYKQYAETAKQLRESSSLWNAPEVVRLHGEINALITASETSDEALSRFMDENKAVLSSQYGPLNILLAYKRMSTTFGDNITEDGILSIRIQGQLQGTEYRYSQLRFSTRKEISSGMAPQVESMPNPKTVSPPPSSISSETPEGDTAPGEEGSGAPNPADSNPQDAAGQTDQSAESQASWEEGADTNYSEEDDGYNPTPAAKTSQPKSRYPDIYPHRFAPLAETDPAQEMVDELTGDQRAEALRKYMELIEAQASKVERAEMIKGVLQRGYNYLQAAKTAIAMRKQIAAMPFMNQPVPDFTPEQKEREAHIAAALRDIEQLPQLIAENADKTIDQLLTPTIKTALDDCQWIIYNRRPTDKKDITAASQRLIDFTETGELPEATRAKMGKVEIVQELLRSELNNIESSRTKGEWLAQAFEYDETTLARKELIEAGMKALERVPELIILYPDRDINDLLPKEVTDALEKCNTDFKQKSDEEIIAGLIGKGGLLAGKDPRTMEELQAQYNLLIAGLRKQKDYEGAQRLMEDKVLREYFAEKVAQISTQELQNDPKSRYNALRGIAHNKADPVIEKYRKYWDSQGATDEEMENWGEGIYQQYLSHLLKQEAGRMIYAEQERSGKIFTGANQKLWEQYDEMLDPGDEFFNLADKTFDTIIDEVAINAPLIIISGGIASMARAGVSMAARAILTSARFARIGARVGLAVEGGVMGGRVLVGSGRMGRMIYRTGQVAGLVVEGTVFEMTHMGLQGDWLFSQEDWMKRIIYSTATLGAFHFAGRQSARLTKALENTIPKIKNSKLASKITDLFVHGSIETATMMTVGYVQHGLETGEWKDYDVANELFRALLTVGALKVAGHGSKMVITASGATIMTIRGKPAERATARLETRYKENMGREAVLTEELGRLKAESAKYRKRNAKKKGGKAKTAHEAREARIQELETELGAVREERGKLDAIDAKLKDDVAGKQERAAAAEKARIEEFVRREGEKAQKTFKEIAKLTQIDPVTGEVPARKLGKAKRKVGELKDAIDKLPEGEAKAELLKQYESVEASIKGHEVAQQAKQKFDPKILEGEDVELMRRNTEELTAAEGELRALLGKEGLAPEAKNSIQRALDAIAANKRALHERMSHLDKEADLGRRIEELEERGRALQQELRGLSKQRLKPRQTARKRKELQEQIRAIGKEKSTLRRELKSSDKVEDTRLAEESRLRTEEAAREETRQKETAESMAESRAMAEMEAHETAFAKEVALRPSVGILKGLVGRLFGGKEATRDSISSQQVANAKRILVEMETTLAQVPDGLPIKGELMGKVEGFRMVVRSRELLLELNTEANLTVLESGNLEQARAVEGKYVAAEAELRRITEDASLPESSRTEARKVLDIVSERKQAIGEKITEAQRTAEKDKVSEDPEWAKAREINEQLQHVAKGDVIISKSGNRRIVIDKAGKALILLKIDATNGREEVEFYSGRKNGQHLNTFAIDAVTKAIPETAAKAEEAAERYKTEIFGYKERLRAEIEVESERQASNERERTREMEITQRLSNLQEGDVIVSKSGNKRLVVKVTPKEIAILKIDKSGKKEGIEVFDRETVNLDISMLKEVTQAGTETRRQAQEARREYKEEIDLVGIEFLTPEQLEIFRTRQEQLLKERGTLSKKEFERDFKDKDSPLEQGNVGDCYLVAALNSLRRSPFFETIVRLSVKPSSKGGKRGWEVKVPFGDPNGEVIFVSQAELGRHENPNFGQKMWDGSEDMDNRRYVEPMKGPEGLQVLEAAFSKSKTRSEQVRMARIEGGYGHQALLHLLGKRSFKQERVSASDKSPEDLRAQRGMTQFGFDQGGSFAETGTSFSRERVRQFLDNYDNTNNIATVNTPKSPKSKGDRDTFKVAGRKFYYSHAYSIVSVNRASQRVTVVNPHDTAVKIEMSYGEFMETFGQLSSVRVNFRELMGQFNEHLEQVAQTG